MTLQQARFILERHAGLFLRAYLYGSVARGEQDESSDLDLLLVRNTGREFFDRIREVMGMVSELGAVDLSEGLRWLRQAENDLSYASLGLREGFFAQVCFQAQ